MIPIFLVERAFAPDVASLRPKLAKTHCNWVHRLATGGNQVLSMMLLACAAV
jgi:hypothetical protein